jgi:hypothetical protein
MYPKPLTVIYDNAIYRQNEKGKSQKISISDLSEKELLLRMVVLSQSIRSMFIFLVLLVIIEIIGGIVIISKLLG